MIKRYIEITLARDARPLILFMERRGQIRYMRGKQHTIPSQNELTGWVRESLLPMDCTKPCCTDT